MTEVCLLIKAVGRIKVGPAFWMSASDEKARKNIIISPKTTSREGGRSQSCSRSTVTAGPGIQSHIMWFCG